MTVGAELGLRVGEEVGSCVGEELGSSVGGELGSRVGEVLGSRVGEMLGSRVGEELGSSVGEELGEALGEELGSRVGEELGSRVGEMLGSCVGEELGPCVGEEMGSSVDEELGLRVGEELGSRVGEELEHVATPTLSTSQRGQKLSAPCVSLHVHLPCTHASGSHTGQNCTYAPSHSPMSTRRILVAPVVGWSLGLISRDLPLNTIPLVKLFKIPPFTARPLYTPSDKLSDDRRTLDPLLNLWYKMTALMVHVSCANHMPTVR